MERKYLLAKATIPITEDILLLANRLSGIIHGFNFQEETSGRFEEVPAFVAHAHGMEYILFGIPEDEVGDEYVLEFECDTNKSIEDLLAEDKGGFTQSFLRDKSVNERGFLDCSTEFAEALGVFGIVGCQPIRPIAQ